jgi:ABC-type lipoprotein export system ATPase subunit
MKADDNDTLGAYDAIGSKRGSGEDILAVAIGLFSLILSAVFTAYVLLIIWLDHRRRHLQQQHQLATKNDSGVSFVESLDEEQEAPPIKDLENASHFKNNVLLSWNNISCSYENRKGEITTSLCNAHGQLRAGQVTAIMGPSGAGKSTLLNILAGRKAVGAVTGQMSIFGQSVITDDMKQAASLLERKVAYVPQEQAFFPMQTAEEAVRFTSCLRHGKNAISTPEIFKLLREVGLTDSEMCQRPIGGTLAGGIVVPGLSGGEKKRLATAMALVLKPTLLMLDEITRYAIYEFETME